MNRWVLAVVVALAGCSSGENVPIPTGSGGAGGAKDASSVDARTESGTDALADVREAAPIDANKPDEGGLDAISDVRGGDVSDALDGDVVDVRDDATSDARDALPDTRDGAVDASDTGNDREASDEREAGPTPAPVDLGTAGNFVILSKAGVSTVPASAITGDMGVSPAAATYFTGFSLVADPSNVFSTSTQVTGKVYAADYAPPTPSNLTTAVSDMQTAFVDAAGRPADFIELGGGNISGATLTPGVYKWSTPVLATSNVTLTGSGTDVWIFQVAQTLMLGPAATVFMSGGATPKNVFWQVSGLVDLDTTSHLEGVVLTATSVSMHTGASINGRLLAQTAVTLQANTVVQP